MLWSKPSELVGFGGGESGAEDVFRADLEGDVKREGFVDKTLGTYSQVTGEASSAT